MYKVKSSHASQGRKEQLPAFDLGLCAMQMNGQLATRISNLILNEIPERSREMRYFAILALYGCTELRDYIKGVVDACNI